MKTSFVAIVVAFLSSGVLAMPAQAAADVANRDDKPHNKNNDQLKEKSGDGGVAGAVSSLTKGISNVLGGESGSASKADSLDN
ncbi:hypothetical protein GQ602_007027 [Ophiocordyceps camponoti-floridani]|uniref:Uncharacterized protein n=1 Tax=Ophiocordyceps camponoti-floridani TaxID=2030778 RepID=A0A8H4Q0K8_9HYPO|nr:hypothetical protein GQ602_007027 [Ophiocordyceps camponoti-floridani]